MHRTKSLLIAVAGTCVMAPAVADAASVTPVLVPGNPSCADVQGAETWTELKKDGPGGVVVLDDGTVKVTATISGDEKSLSFSATAGIDAVIVKAGTEANVYVYDPDSTGDTDLVVPPADADISHVTFCYGPDAPGQPQPDPEPQPQPDPAPEPAPAPDLAPAAAPEAAPPVQQQVLGVSAQSPPSAKLSGRTGCVSTAFTASVRGSRIKQVTFSLDGRKVRTVRSGRFTARISPVGLRGGAHRVTARITFTNGSTATKRLTFLRCVKAVVKPTFAG